MSAPTVTAPAAGSGARTRLPSMWTGITTPRIVTLTIVLAALLFGLPEVLGSFWMRIVLQAVIYSAVSLGLGLLVGRAGMFSLCQIPLFAAGAWISLRISNIVDMPFPILLIVTGLLTGALGAFIGIPALRLSGLYLALITLMGAGALTLVLQNAKFPNGGGGFWGFDKSLASGATSLDRPSIAEGQLAYYRYVVVVVSLLFLLVTWHIKGKPGRAWAAIRQSQVTAVAAGVHTTLYKLWAFALSAFVTGVAGALLAASAGVSVNQFPVEQSIVLLAVVLMGGVYNIWGAVVAGFFLRVLPQLLDQKLGLSGDILTILFGIGVMQVLLTAPGGAVEDLAKLGRKIVGLFSRTRPQTVVTPAPVAAADDGVVA
jgi:branched-chain amino acid transport system permease protein